MTFTDGSSSNNITVSSFILDYIYLNISDFFKGDGFDIFWWKYPKYACWFHQRTCLHHVLPVFWARTFCWGPISSWKRGPSSSWRWTTWSHLLILIDYAALLHFFPTFDTHLHLYLNIHIILIILHVSYFETFIYILVL